MQLFEEAIREMSKRFSNEEKVGKTDQSAVLKVEQYMKQAGISTGYIKKPCLNPFDPQCPESAPNKKSRQSSDMGNTVVSFHRTSDDRQNS